MIEDDDNSDIIEGVDLTGESYSVKQSMVRNAYSVLDSEGSEILETKQKLFKMKEEFPFLDPDGEEVFRVKAAQVMDISGDYSITDPEGEELAVLTQDFTILTHRWRIKDSGGKLLAKVESRGKVVGLLRFLSDIFQLLPHKYTIEDEGGEEIGSIKGKLGLRDRYVINIGDIDKKEIVLAAAITIDALEGN
ncbi:MAG: LURP-one-related/scramblase family protein [Candidatus Nanohaloarchaea archaeon]